MATETVPMEDAALFASATDATPETPAVTAEPEPQPQPEAGQPRDEHGRFAPKAEETPPEQVAQPEPEQPTPQPAIPPARLREEADARRAAEARASALERQMSELLARLPTPPAPQPKPKPDFFENPDEATAHIVQEAVSPQITALRQQVMQIGRMAADALHGADKVAAADKAFSDAYEAGQLDPAEYAKVMRSANIYDAAVRWHKQQSVRQRIGDDLDGFLAKREEELLNDPNFMAKVAEKLRANGNAQPTNGNGQRPAPVVLPPSLNKVTAAAPNALAPAGSLNDADLYSHATS